MLIAIPTAGRASKQVTLRSLKSTGLAANTVLVVPDRERVNYLNVGHAVVLTPGDVTGIAATRHWILTDLARSRGERYVCMLDDDMDFCWRPDMSSPELVTIKDHARLKAMLDTLEGWLQGGFVHVGLSARQGNNHEHQPYKDATRMMNAYAYDCERLGKLMDAGLVTMGRTPVMEDFDLTLQLIKLGLPNRVSYEYCWNQRGSGAEGGCSTYRTSEMQAAAAHRLSELHPGVVRVTEKNSPSQRGAMAQRVDVTVQWAKAYASAPAEVDRHPLVRVV